MGGLRDGWDVPGDSHSVRPEGGYCHVELGQVRALGRQGTHPLQSDALLILCIAVIKPYDPYRRGCLRFVVSEGEGP